MRMCCRFFSLTLAAWLTIAGIAVAFAAEESLEYSVKAAYLLKFGGFIEWPSRTFTAPDEPFVIGVLGDDPFGPTLDQIAATHTVQGRPITLKKLSRIEQVRNVHVLYISPSEKERMPLITASLEGKGILTVADADLPGAMVNFVVDNNRVRFDINLEQAERAGLKVSSKLLSVARAVRVGRR